MFAEKGYEAASVEEIAERAKISKPVVYEHFGGKEGLYAVIVDREMEYVIAQISAAISDGTPRERVEAASLAFMRYVHERPSGFAVLSRDAPVTTGLSNLLAEVAHRVGNVFRAEFKRAGLKLVIEPINFHDIPGFFLNRTEQALEILDLAGADNAYVQYDIYHAQRMEGELAATMEKHLPRIAHMQLADNPGRHEPGTGEIHYPFLFAHLDRIGYTGWIGCEYRPATTTEAGLSWLAPWGIGRAAR